MRVAVLGAGVVGVSTAWQLLKDGHEVTVVDRGQEAANFSSHANAGCVGAGYAMAWGSPRAFTTMRRSLLRRDHIVRLRPTLSPEFWRWVRRFRRECTAERAAANTTAMARLCVYSQGVLRDVVGETGVEFNRRAEGLLYFFRNQESLARAMAASEIMEAAGVPIEHVDGSRAAALLGDRNMDGPNRDSIAGGLFAPEDESGDARLFTLALAERCREAGADFRFGTDIDRLVIEGGKAVATETQQGRIEADAFVVCLGVFSRALLRPVLREHGLDLPIYPVKGYSATFPVRDGDAPPTIGGVDVDRGLAFAPFGERLRMTRTLHFDGYRTTYRPADFRNLVATARMAFPAGADYAQPTHWAGLRPMTPTGMPVIDWTPVEGLWLNSGQGNFGWTMAAGSARILADLLASGKTAISRAGLELAPASPVTERARPR